MRASDRAAGSPRAAAPTPLDLAYLLFLAIVVAVVYLPMWHFAPYLDDLAAMRGAEAGLLDGAFAGRHMFRPLELVVIQSSLDVTGDPALAHVVSFLGFLFSIGLVYWLGRRIDPRRPALAMVAAALFACHPVNVSAVFQIDTVSQQLATVFVLAGFAWCVLGPDEPPLRYHAIGAGLSCLALLSKEVAAGAIFALPLAMALVQRLLHGRPLPDVARRCLLSTAIAAALLLAYLAMRMLAGADLVVEGGRYSLELSPVSVVKNALVLLGSMGYLGSTLEIFLLDSPLRIALSVVISAVVIGLALVGAAGTVVGLRRGSAERRSSTLAAAAGVMLLASLFPAALIKHPSELYAYLGMPFYVLLLGFLAVRGAESVARRLHLPIFGSRILAAGAVASCCLWLLFGVHEKLDFAQRMSERTEMFSEQMARWYIEGSAPLASMPACVARAAKATSQGPYYSVFKIPDHTLLQYTYAWLAYQHAPRRDLPWDIGRRGQCQVMIEVEDGGRLRLRPAKS